MAVVVDVKSSYKGEQKVRNAIEEFLLMMQLYITIER